VEWRRLAGEEDGDATSVARIIVRMVEVPLEHPVETAAGSFASSPLVLLDMADSDGVTGCCYIRCNNRLVWPSCGRLVKDLASALVGHPAHPDSVRHLSQACRLIGLTGLVRMCLGAIDVALWDCEAKRLGQNLRSCVGLASETLRAYKTVRAMEAGPAAVEAGQIAEEGFEVIKVKLGGGDLEEDLRVVRSVRSAIGDDMGLLADYNQSLSVSEAQRRIAALTPFALKWVEEPTHCHDLSGNALITSTRAVPVQLGENWYDSSEVRANVEAHTSDLAMLDLVRIGGVSGWIEAGEICRRGGLAVSSHAYPEVSSHLLTEADGDALLEYSQAPGGVLEEAAAPENGRYAAPPDAGTGMHWNERALLRLGVSQV
jgi:mandelate racemase